MAESVSTFLIGTDLSDNSLVAQVSSEIYGQAEAKICVFDVYFGSEITNIAASGTVSLPELDSIDPNRPNVNYEWLSTIAIKSDGDVNAETIFVPLSPSAINFSPIVYSLIANVQPQVQEQVIEQVQEQVVSVDLSVNDSVKMSSNISAKEESNTEVSSQWNVSPSVCSPPQCNSGVATYQTLLTSSNPCQEGCLENTCVYTFAPSTSEIAVKGPELASVVALTGMVNAANNTNDIATLKGSTLIALVAVPFVNMQ